MRVDSLALSWFRGAGPQVTLKPARKSVVLYGANGAGKSSFADALEYIVSNGKIGHLTHEYSGRGRHRFGLRNTHAPENATTQVRLQFRPGRYLEATVFEDGRLSLESEPIDLGDQIQNWDLERFLLRQDEVAHFIHASKGEKYSVLLPLLGLETWEQTAINLRGLQKALQSQGELAAKRQDLQNTRERALAILPDLESTTVELVLENLADRYLSGEDTRAGGKLAPDLADAIEAQIGTAEPSLRRFYSFQTMSRVNLPEALDELLAIEREAAFAVGEFVDRQIAVLEAAAGFLDTVQEGPETISCPACGTEISADGFSAHVARELGDMIAARKARVMVHEARARLMRKLQQTRDLVASTAFQTWLEASAEPDHRKLVGRFEALQFPAPGSPWPDTFWHSLHQDLPPLQQVFREAAGRVPHSVRQLLEDRELVAACQLVPRIRALEKKIVGIEVFLDHLAEAEAAVRASIRAQTETTVGQVSTEIQRLWAKLHPNEPIEEVQLYIPENVERAIDICLKFFGVDQPSPRLTLSEGHRNSLGLCIFLALVRLDSDQNRPIILDDVVSSMDRDHRGLLVNVLMEDFADRQIILLTHDREWYTELRTRLPARDWLFQALRPWEEPRTGIQWARSQDTFDDARVLLPISPEAAGNRVRAIMDTQLAFIAEHLHIKVSYTRGDRNDRRTCVEFQERIISEAKSKLYRRNGGAYERDKTPFPEWHAAVKLLITWANRASHGGSLTAGEVEHLIQVCEAALKHYRCHQCGDPIWMAKIPAKRRQQCTCGEIQWRYG